IDSIYFTEDYKKGSLTLKLTYRYAKEAPQIPLGYELGFDQLILKEPLLSFPPTAITPTASNHWEENRTSITIVGDDFCYTFDKLHGTFQTLLRNNKSILERPMEYNIWRAPTDNDRKIRKDWEAARYNRSMIRVYETHVAQEGSTVSITTRLAIHAIQIQHILDLEATWNINADGTITLSLDATRNEALPYLPRFGLRLFLPKSYEAIHYFGYGPFESYVDKRRASYFARFDTTVTDTYEDYLKPQEHGSHFGCNELSLASKDGDILSFFASSPFSFQASHYPQEELSAKAHNYELTASDYTVLCLDYKMSGIGSNSCGPSLSKEYQLCETSFSFDMMLRFR
ncbi:MAG: beta-galactosidase, partial [Clostridiales bacterium]|nr:beta-galactosidase [Clostridiales bacterium]